MPDIYVDANGTPVKKPSPLTKAETIGASQVGERYIPPTFGEVMTSSNPLKGLYEMVMGPTRPPSVAAQDPYGISAWEKGAGPMPMLMGTTQEVSLGNPAGIRAYHGSPHDFEQFSLGKIGTGEGAQAYGHGLYFAEQEGTAKSYRDALSSVTDTPEYRALMGLKQAENDAVIAHFKAPSATSQEAVNRAREAARVAEAAALKAPRGKMYEVNIKADPAHFLDYDKPISQQGPEIKAKVAAAWDALEAAGTPVSEYHELIGTARGSQALKEAGIPGIKYLDQGSRASGDGTRNFVVFDDQTIDILRKYGLLPPLAGAAAKQIFVDENGTPVKKAR